MRTPLQLQYFLSRLHVPLFCGCRMVLPVIRCRTLLFKLFILALASIITLHRPPLTII